MRPLPFSFVVEIADTPEARARGLMDRTSSTGMLFLFDRPTMSAFWNERTLLPLDLFFIDSAGRVVTRHAMATIYETHGVPVEYRPTEPYVAALELPRGRAPAMVHRVTVGPRADRHAMVELSR